MDQLGEQLFTDLNSEHTYKNMRHRKIRAQMKNVLFYRYFGMVLLKIYLDRLKQFC